MFAPRSRHVATAGPARGFTAVEVLLALCLTGFIALCVLSMTMASSQIWAHQQESAGAGTSGARAKSYVERVLRSAQDVGYWSEGSDEEPAALFLWAHDKGTRQPEATRDHQVQQCELMLIRHDPVGGKIKLYRSREYSLLSPAERLLAEQLMTTTQFNSRLTADTFAALPWVQEHDLVGSGGETVQNVTWNVDRTGDNPIVRLRFDVVRAGVTQTVNATVSLRVRDAEDDWSKTILELGLIGDFLTPWRAMPA